MLCTALSLSGCEVIPPNNFRLITAEPAGRHPTLLHFNNGTFLQQQAGGVAMLAGQSAVALFDYQGTANRFDLLLIRGNERALYERIGSYGPLKNPSADARPIGIQTAARGKQLRGTVDVFVTRSERRDPSTTFEHFPRAMRVVGYFILPTVSPTAGRHPLASLLQPNQTEDGTAYPDLHTMQPMVGQNRLTTVLAGLPPLPLIDIEYLVPTTLLSAFRPATP